MSVMSEGPNALPVQMIKLTETPEITPYKGVHPDEERTGAGRESPRSTFRAGDFFKKSQRHAACG